MSARLSELLMTTTHTDCGQELWGVIPTGDCPLGSAFLPGGPFPLSPVPPANTGWQSSPKPRSASIFLFPCPSFLFSQPSSPSNILCFPYLYCVSSVSPHLLMSSFQVGSLFCSLVFVKELGLCLTVEGPFVRFITALPAL